MEIQPATKGMEPILTELAHKSKSYWGYGSRLMELWSEQLTIKPDYLEENIVDVVYEGNQAIGFYSINRGSCELEDFWVDPKNIGSGIGELMFLEVMKKMRENNIQQLIIISDPHASGFYEKMGAVNIGEVESVPSGRTLPKFIFHLTKAEPVTVGDTTR